MQNLKGYLIMTVIVIVIAGAAFLAGRWQRKEGFTALPPATTSQGQPIAQHNAPPPKTVRVLDKPALEKAGFIPKTVAENKQQEVTASAVVKDDSGTRKISAIMDMGTGSTELVQKRPLMEMLHSNEIGLEAGVSSKGVVGEGVYWDHEWTRVGSVFLSSTVSLDRFSDKTIEGSVWVRTGLRF